MVIIQKWFNVHNKLPRNGAATKSRTPDILLTKQTLYQLSYNGILKQVPRFGFDYQSKFVAVGYLIFNSNHSLFSFKVKSFCLL